MRALTLIVPMFLVAALCGAPIWGLQSSANAAGACPRASAGYADGCAAAPPTGQFLQPDFFSMARQSGQSQYRDASGARSDHPPPWNVAGVDYPDGLFSSVALLLVPFLFLFVGCAF